ncbi:MAG TPA: phage tail sheath C-terminal domain-containing protein [Kofleriaceae bacterium]|nr:phage tail sheath C-terminal domain-containing protein [Kofleriaceae bacterium]
MTIFRWEISPGGSKKAVEQEKFLNLSMDSASPSYVVTTLGQKSKLVDAIAGTITGAPGYSLSTIPIAAASFSTLANAVNTMRGKGSDFRVTLGSKPPVKVTAPAMVGTTDFATTRSSWATALQGAIQTAVTNAGITGLPTPPAIVSVLQGPTAAAGETTVVRISAPAGQTYDVRVTSADTNDLALQLGLGPANNGIEVGAYADARPAPTGVTFLDTAGLSAATLAASNWVALANTNKNAFTGVTLDELDATGTLVPKTITFNLGGAQPIWIDSTGGGTGVLEALGEIADAINSYQAANPTSFFWRASVWGQRLAIIDASGDDNSIVTGGLAFTGTGTLPADMLARFLGNVRYYSLGPNGTAGRQSGPVPGSDGTAPAASDYTAAYNVARTDIDLFNLLVLPPDAAPAVPLEQLWGEASALCAAERAFLIMDPPDLWVDSQSASSGVNALRPGLTKDYSAVYFPRLKLVENGREYTVGPAGAIAGVYARIDSTRGVWKAPAGSEADVRGVTGIDVNMSDLQNGQINPVGVNAVRLFPEGVISWGARTMDGADAFASEYKYVPIRRLALFMEESLYRGLKWVVFEPNDEPLWAQIRLNVGAFMHDLFRKGAFQGTKPSDAYFVKCDKETTTANDQNLGIVNIWVGFAPLKPAEFVVLYLQQIAGQLPT